MLNKIMTELEFEKDTREYRTIAKETKITKIIALWSLLFIFILGLSSYFVDKNRKEQTLTVKSTKISVNSKNIQNKENIPNLKNNDNNKDIEDIFLILNIFVIILLLGILTVKRTIYYSPKLIKEGDNLEQVLKQWRKIDTALIGITQLIPIIGLVITTIGMEFRRTNHFFIASILLIIMLMPMGIKVRSRLKVLKKYFTNIL